MLGDSVIKALEEQERNKHKKKQRDEDKKIPKYKTTKINKSETKLNKSKENINIIPSDTIPGDSEEINTNEININKINLPSNIKKNKLKLDKNNNNIINPNQEYNQPKIPKKKLILIPKSNTKYNSKSPDQNNKILRQKDDNINSDYKIKHKRSNSNNNIKIISKDEIIKKIKESIQDVDQRYLNTSFNLMQEIINVFGDINFEKVKQDIDRLKQVNSKLDDIIKIIVDKHSDEFFQILGYVRETKNII